MTDLEASLVLNMLPSVGPIRYKRLITAVGSPVAVLSAKGRELRNIAGVDEDVITAILNWNTLVDLDRELTDMQACGARAIDSSSPEYPKLLKEIHAPPIVLYVIGNILERDCHAIGIVGSRQSSIYGAECARRFGYQLAYAGLTVVSGLAMGIDTYAHQGALAAKGRTIAVLGSGLKALYPPENKLLAERISNSGAVISEFPMRTKPDRQTFPMRNRIVSGCSIGVLVVEAATNSGAMITANQAVEQGRAVYAVPGPINSPSSQGCNRLIQQGAKLVTDVSDLLDDFGLLFSPADLPKTEQRPPPQDLSDQERAVFLAIGTQETHVDDIIRISKLPSHQVLSKLFALELRRIVKQLPGKFFVRLDQTN